MESDKKFELLADTSACILLSYRKVKYSKFYFENKTLRFAYLASLSSNQSFGIKTYEIIYHPHST